MNVTVIGAGLAGSECAWQLAQRGIQVELHEMKPEKMTPAHTTEYFAELCCSNSLRGDGSGKRRGSFEGGTAAAGQLDPRNAPMPPGWRLAARWRWTATALPDW